MSSTAKPLKALVFSNMGTPMSRCPDDDPPRPRKSSVRWALGRFAQKPLDQHAVLPLPVEAPVAALDADLLEPGRAMHGAARCVGGEDAARQLVEPAALGLGRELVEQAPAQALASGRRVDVHGVLADPGGEGAGGGGGHARGSGDAGGAVPRGEKRAGAPAPS